ncbi:MAG: hypothetical protein Kow0068_12290 [Marinilabiliales bacterium]
MNKFRFYILLFLFSGLFIPITLFAKDKDERWLNYKKAKIVFIGKVENVREMPVKYKNDSDLFIKKLMIEFEITQIYKGKRFVRLIVIDDVDINQPDYFINGREYIVYLVKNKEKKAETRYKILRSRRFGDDGTQEENIYLVNRIRKSFFRTIKQPVPMFRFIPGG